MHGLKSSTTVTALLALSGIALGGATLEYVGQGIGLTDLSEDGTVAVGNTIEDGEFETFRWVKDDPAGWQRLGRSTVSITGAGAGGPNVSYDGTRVSATIIDDTNTAQTWGVWTEGQGWQQKMPPYPPDAAPFTNSIASAWCLSGDGDSVGGFYWSTGGIFGNKAQPAIWQEGTGVISRDPVVPQSNARVNAINFDGSIWTGYSEDTFGSWMPTVWRDGTATWLVTDYGAGNNWFLNSYGMNADGTVIVGQAYNPVAARADATRWVWNGTSYDEEILGALPGTPQTDVGQTWARSVSDDGSIIVGTNRFFDNGPFSTVTGFVWTEAEGMRDIIDVMADEGLAFPNAGWYVQELYVSPDGSAIGGIVLDTNTVTFLDYWSFIVRFAPPPMCDGDVNGDGTTTLADFTILAANFGATGLPSGDGESRGLGDLNDDGNVDLADFTILALDFGCDVNTPS
ncbi:MAG: dockerin type I domain-containing protein [Planctomycetota bacterium]